jgi:hypothetical protein
LALEACLLRACEKRSLKVPFAVTQGATSGTVHIMAKATARRASCDWEWSNDGGKAWVALPSTLQAKTSLAGIPSGMVAQFRYRAVTKTGVSDWRAATAFLVK